MKKLNLVLIVLILLTLISFSVSADLIFKPNYYQEMFVLNGDFSDRDEPGQSSQFNYWTRGSYPCNATSNVGSYKSPIYASGIYIHCSQWLRLPVSQSKLFIHFWFNGRGGFELYDSQGHSMYSYNPNGGDYWLDFDSMNLPGFKSGLKTKLRFGTNNSADDIFLTDNNVSTDFNSISPVTGIAVQVDDASTIGIESARINLYEMKDNNKLASLTTYSEPPYQSSGAVLFNLLDLNSEIIKNKIAVLVENALPKYITIKASDRENYGNDLNVALTDITLDNNLQANPIIELWPIYLGNFESQTGNALQWSEIRLNSELDLGKESGLYYSETPACKAIIPENGRIVCLLPKKPLINVVDNNVGPFGRIKYTMTLYNSHYDTGYKDLNFTGIMVPNDINFASIDPSKRLSKFFATNEMGIDGVYDVYLFYPTTSGDVNFVISDSIDSDFSFVGDVSVSYRIEGDNKIYSCSITPEASSFTATHESGNCASVLRRNASTDYDWIKVHYKLQAPGINAFIGDTKSYVFPSASITVEQT